MMEALKPRLRVGDQAGVLRYLQDPEALARVNDTLQRELVRREVLFGGRLLPSFPIPDLTSVERERETAEIVEAFAALLEQLGSNILDSGDLGAIGLSPEAKPLLEIEPGYSRLNVISRLDMSNVTTLSLFEANTDSPAMMTFTDLLEEILLATELREVIGVDVPRLRRTRSMLAAVLECYKEWGGTRDDPTIAIVDWPGEMTASELRHTAAAFTELGCPSVVCHPGELSIVDGHVHAHGHRIDIIQRRVLFPDFIKRAGELEAFTEAYRRGLVCVANPLRSIVIGNKAILGLLSERASDFVDASAAALARDLLPETFRLTQENASRVLENKDEWVVKCSLGSGGKAVALGVTTEEDDWRTRINDFVDRVAVVQRKQDITVFHVPVLDSDGTVSVRELFANWNPWVFGGRYASASTRVSREMNVSISAGGGLLPSIGV